MSVESKAVLLISSGSHGSGSSLVFPFRRPFMKHLNIAKSWMFASFSPRPQALAGTCTHGRDAHESFAGKKFLRGLCLLAGCNLPSWLHPILRIRFGSSFACSSTLLCAIFTFFSLSQIPVKPQSGSPTATQDGGGIANVPD